MSATSDWSTSLRGEAVLSIEMFRGLCPIDGQRIIRASLRLHAYWVEQRQNRAGRPFRLFDVSRNHTVLREQSATKCADAASPSPMNRREGVFPERAKVGILSVSGRGG